MILDLLGYGAFFLSTALIFGLITLGLNLQWGLTGLFNVGIAGFVAIGAYASAILTSPDVADRIGGFGWPIWAGWLAAMLIAGAAAAFTGYATLRLKADYLAITTFGVAVVVQLTPLQQGAWWQESGSAVLLSAALKELRPALPADFGRHLPS